MYIYHPLLGVSVYLVFTLPSHQPSAVQNIQQRACIYGSGSLAPPCLAPLGPSPLCFKKSESRPAVNIYVNGRDAAPRLLTLRP